MCIRDRALILQQNRLRWYGHVLRKDDDDWVKKCTEYEAKGSRPRERPKRTWKEVVREDCQARKLNKEYAMDCCKWRKVIKEVRWPGWVWAGECFFWYRPTRVVPDKRPLNGCCCCCADLQWKRLKNIHVGHTTAYIYLPRMLLQMILCKRTTTIITKSFMTTTFWNKFLILGLFFFNPESGYCQVCKSYSL